MTENYEIIEEIIRNTLSEMYKEMNEYFENIINSPSTINRIFKYYAIGLPSDPTIHERYIMFGGTIVRKYVIENPKYGILLQSRLKELGMND